MTLADGPEPFWAQLAGILTERISSGTYPPGSRMPSITDLTQEFGLARSTVQKALGEMKRRGLIVTSVMGTFVAG